MSEVSATGWTAFMSRLTRKIDRPIVIAFACIVALLLVGGMYSRNFMSPEYILLQLKVGAFLVIVSSVESKFLGESATDVRGAGEARPTFVTTERM